ncbi:MAG TPA: SpoVR family protein [Candidatus Binatia bacterium]|nr:SpoVR family protein [Candidatus Binatia bacterium]
MSWTLKDLEYWDARIREKVEEFGLDCFPQEFEICDHAQMLGYMAYSGMPSHYPHWSYGKAYEKLKTLYDYGVSGLPYEMVINANPSIAYLMRDNSLCLQILTIAHVYGHNDFFKNNFTFRTTRPEFTVGTFKAHADRVRHYVESPAIGLEKVEAFLDAAHALSLQCRRNLAVRKLSEEDERQRLLALAEPQHDPFQRIHRRPETTEPDLRRVPPTPDEDILPFIRDHNPFLAEWERDLLTIVHDEAQYFIPQIETKIMNEGWASYFHKRIMDALELPQDLHLEFLVRHTQVLRPMPGGLNPYHLGYKVWEDIERRGDDPTPEEREDLPPGTTGRDLVFQTRQVDRDTSFLRRWLHESLMRDLDLFRYEAKGEDLVVSDVSDRDGWRQVKETLVKSVGMGSVPSIRVEDADHNHNRTLLLVHNHDGRDLQLEYAEKTLGYVQRLWGHDVVLESVVNGKRTLLTYGERGFSAKAAK